MATVSATTPMAADTKGSGRVAFLMATAPKLGLMAASLPDNGCKGNP
ncbi:MAG: hypothetical protein R2795_25790 [Saprospiraceae bacterium]